MATYHLIKESGALKWSGAALDSGKQFLSQINNNLYWDSNTPEKKVLGSFDGVLKWDIVSNIPAGLVAIFGGGLNGVTAYNNVEYRATNGVGSNGTGLSDAGGFDLAVATQLNVIFAGGSNAAQTTFVPSVNYRDYRGVGSTGSGLWQPRNRIAGTNIRDAAYFCGGWYGSVTTQFQFRMSTAAGNDVTVLTVARADMAAAPLGGDKGLFVGGYLTESSQSAIVEYRTRTGTASTGSGLMAARSNLAGAGSGDKAIFTGGQQGTSLKSETEIYTNEAVRTTSYSLSPGRSNPAAATAEQKAVFAGGGSSTDTSPTDQVQYFSAFAITSGSSLSAARTRLAGATAGDYALFGGGLASEAVATLEYRDPTGYGTTGSPLSVARSHLAGAGAMPPQPTPPSPTAANAVFAGGYGQDQNRNFVNYRNSSGTGGTGTNLSEARQRLSGAQAGVNAIFAGGFVWNGTSVNTTDYRTPTGTGSSAAGLNVGRCDFDGAGTGSVAIFGGGMNSTTTSFSNVEYRNATGIGTTGMSLSYARKRLAAAKAGGLVVFAGGCGADGQTVVTTEYRNSAGLGFSALGLTWARSRLSGSSAGNYAMFSGGGETDAEGSFSYYVDYRTPEGVGGQGDNLGLARSHTASATSGDSGDSSVIAGGRRNDDHAEAAIDYRYQNGNGGTGTSISPARYGVKGARAGGNAIFAGGKPNDDDWSAAVDIISAQGVATSGTALTQAVTRSAAASTGT